MNRFLPLIFIILITCLIFFKIFTRGLFPIPGDLLVSFWFPWNSGGWEGYNSFTFHKEFLDADSVRQIYPWKEFAAKEFKKGQFPNWNPYTFSGQPLAANLQSGVYYPLNLFYLLTDSKNAWILLVTSQILLAGTFMFLAASSFKLKQVSAIFASVAFMFSSYVITWIENVNIIHSYIWLPLAVWAVNKYSDTKKLRYTVILIISLASSILAGHPQTSIYVIVALFIYWVFKFWNYKSKNIWPVVICIATALLISAVQIIPTISFYKISPVSLPFSKEVFDWSIMPYRNLITFLASDFFGHPATDNFWSNTYGDFTPYIGVIPLILAVWIIFRAWTKKYNPSRFIKFASVVSIFFIIAMVHSPITYLIKTLRIPLLDSTTPSRFVSISLFFLALIAAFGFEDFVNNFQDKKYWKQFVKFLFFTAVIYAMLWAFTFIGKIFLEPQEKWARNLAVTRKNLILPTLMLFSIPAGTIFTTCIKEKLKLTSETTKTIVITGIFVVLILGGVYYSNKFLPVAPKKFIFPNHPVFDWIKNNAGIDRFYGQGVAHIDFSFPIPYQIYAAEGYDTLRIERYAQLLASSYTGKVPKTYLRSDAVFPTEENGYRKRLFDLLGVKYIPDKVDEPRSTTDWRYERYKNDSLEGIWQQDKFQMYRRKTALPRVFLTTRYIVAKTDEEIIDNIYNHNFDLKTLILEKEPEITIEKNKSEIIIPKVTIYDPQKIIINTKSDNNSLLFISDVYDRDWKVSVDGTGKELLRTDYALRSVAVPKGEHNVIFKYEQKSFKQSLVVTTVAVTLLIMLSLYWIRAKRF